MHKQEYHTLIKGTKQTISKEVKVYLGSFYIPLLTLQVSGSK